MTSRSATPPRLDVNEYNVHDADYADYYEESVIDSYLRESGWDPVHEHSVALENADHPLVGAVAQEFSNREPIHHLSDEERLTRWEVHHAAFDAVNHPDPERAAEAVAEEVFHPLRNRLDAIAYAEFRDPEAIPTSNLAYTTLANEQANFAVALSDGEDYAAISMAEAYDAAQDAIASASRPLTRSSINWEEFTNRENVDSEHYEFIASNFATTAFADADRAITDLEDSDPAYARMLRGYSHHLQADMATQIINDLEAGSVEAIAPQADYGQHHLMEVLQGNASFVAAPPGDLDFLTDRSPVSDVAAAEDILQNLQRLSGSGALNFANHHAEDYWTYQQDRVQDAIQTLHQHRDIDNIEHIHSDAYQTVNSAVAELALMARR